MAEEYSFVEVLMITYQPGEKEHQDFFENEVHCFDASWEDCSEEIEEVKQAKIENDKNAQEAEQNGQRVFTTLSVGYEPDTLITKPLTAFQFRCFGQSLDREYASGIDYEAKSMDNAYIFENWLDSLKEIGQKILVDKKAMGHPQATRVVRFVTLWSYSSWIDTYNHEWDSEWELIGLVEPKKVVLILNGGRK